MKSSPGRAVLYISYDCIAAPLTESQVLPYLKGLSGKYDIFLLTFNKADAGRKSLDEIAEKNGIKKIFALKYHKSPTLPATCFDIFCGIIKAFFIVKKYKISFIHARSYIACAIAHAIKCLSGKPYIFDMRGLLADERADSGDWSKASAAYKLVKFYEKVFLRQADKIIVLSQKGAGVLEGIESSSAGKISVIPTCVDVHLFDWNKKAVRNDGIVRFVYIGSLGTWYMAGEMLDFFKAAAQHLPAARLLILTHSNKRYAEEAVANKGIDKGLVEIKDAPYNEVYRYLGESDVSLFFIKPVFSKQASCPTKFAESLSMGLPVITNSGVGDLEYYVKKYSTGIIVNGFKEEDYKNAAAGISELLKEGRALSARCRDLAVDEFSLESGIFKYTSIYESMEPKR